MRGIIKIPTFLRLYIKLILFDLKLSKKGFNQIFEHYSLKYHASKENKELLNCKSKEIEDFFEMMDIAFAWYPKKADCIHKTLLGYKYLRKKYSIPVHMVVGVRKFPFEAHAWLKLEESDFFESEIDTSHLKIILSSNNIERVK